MVERKVNAMSTPALPLVKKISSVSQMALGCDQKKASIQPSRAPVSHRPTMAMRMPAWTSTIAHAGQSRCTGRRRTTGRPRCAAPAGRAAICGSAAAGTASVVAGIGIAGLRPQAASATASLPSRARQCRLMRTKGGDVTTARARGRGRSIGRLSMMRPGRAAMTWISSER